MSTVAPTPASGAAGGKLQPGWPSLDDDSPKAAGKKRILVLGSGETGRLGSWARFNSCWWAMQQALAQA